MKWLRLWTSLIHDPKVQELPARLFRVWINMLCVAGEQSPRGALPSLQVLAFKLRQRVKRTFADCQALYQAGLLDMDGETYHIHDWGDWQPAEDVSTERVKRFRKRFVPVSETSPDTETETEADTEQNQTPPTPPTDVGDLVDVYRTLPGITASERDGGVMAGLVGKHGVEFVGRVLREHGASVGAAKYPLQYLVKTCAGIAGREKVAADPPRDRPWMLHEEDVDPGVAEAVRTLAATKGMP